MGEAHQPDVAPAADPSALELLRATHLFGSLDEPDLAALAGSCELRNVGEGALLMKEGDPGDHLFIIVAGRFRAVQGSGGDELVLGDLVPGEFAGEVALLQRAPRMASVRAVSEGQVLALSRDALKAFLERHPGLADVFVGALRYRTEWSAMRRYRPAPSVLASKLAELLTDVDEPALCRLADEVQWITVPRGTPILKQGAPGDCVYFVVSGRVRVFGRRDDGTELRIGDVGPGESFGEMALLAAEPRSANVASTSDCQLLRLSKAGFDRLIATHPQVMATFTRELVRRLNQRIRARDPITQLRVGRAVTCEDCAEVTRTSDLVLRNLRITQMYHRLSVEMARLIGQQDANWCTFACNASKTAGYSIRRQGLGLDPLVARLVRFSAAQRAWTAFETVARWLGISSTAILDAISENISAGNLKVFAELSPVFARMVSEFHDDVEYAPEKIGAFIDTLAPGPTEAGGQDLLKEAFASYYDAMFEPNPKRKAEAILLANVKIGFHEQQRLQPNIVAALNAPLTVTGQRVSRRRWMDRIGSLDDRLLQKLMILTRRIVTTRMMELRLPYGDLRLGADLPLLPGQRLFPDMLQRLEQPELIRFLQRFEVDPDSMRGSRAADWGSLDDRMRFIITLFRTRQKSLELFDQPFLYEQRLEMDADRVPAGQL